MECTNNGTPLFDGQNYAFLSGKIKKIVQAQGFDVWQVVVDRYKIPATPPKDKDGKKLSEKKSKAKNVILSGVASSIYVKVIHCEFSKDLWDKL
jgi:hypothetical protein